MDQALDGRIVYQWFTSKDVVVDGRSFTSFQKQRLEGSFILPDKVKVVSSSGGGCTFGYKSRVFKVGGSFV